MRMLVAMSGGVDSSLSAALLKREGHELVGVFIKVWEPPVRRGGCTWREERRDAMRVAAHLKIPLITLDLSEEYRREVVDYFLGEYRAGRTPNPDVLCNRAIKFGALARFARKEGFEALATGHYARTKNGRLYKGVDTNKDQSYFLWMLTKDDLDYTRFPIGHLRKEEVRRQAKRLGIPTAEKKDSQGLCFVGALDFKEFLGEELKTHEGAVLNNKGEQIGTHAGAALYTVGERHGFSIKHRTPQEGASFVVATNVSANTITVSPNIEDSPHFKKHSNLEKCNWIHTPRAAVRYRARLRYRAPLVGATVDASGTSVTLVKPTLATLGQSLVLYSGTECLGGGIIC